MRRTKAIKGGRMDRSRGRVGEVEKKNQRSREEDPEEKEEEKEKHNSLEM